MRDALENLTEPWFASTADAQDRHLPYKLRILACLHVTNWVMVTWPPSTLPTSRAQQSDTGSGALGDAHYQGLVSDCGRSADRRWHARFPA